MRPLGCLIVAGVCEVMFAACGFPPPRLLDESPDAVPSPCGDGIHSPEQGEECDHGSANGEPDDTCDIHCHIQSGCGDSMIDMDKGELCDPGDMDSADCNSRLANQIAPGLGCKPPTCGDG